MKEQEKIIQTLSKVAAIGEMLGNIAHQWRQPLSVITTSASGMVADIKLGNKLEDKDIEEYSSLIIKQSEYLSKTIDDFRNFFASDTEDVKEHHVKTLFSHLKELVVSAFKNNFIECVDNIEDGIFIKANETLLIQALINICNNAKDAIVENVKETHLRYLFVDVKKEGNNLVIIFKDSGGIKDEIIDKVFEPYFTTKHQSVGTGIGLYMTNQIITKQLEGSISVTNEEYVYDGKNLKGAKFTITIPLNMK